MQISSVLMLVASALFVVAEGQETIEKKDNWKIVNACQDNKQAVMGYEYGRPRNEANKYNLVLRGNFTEDTIIDIKFDAPVIIGPESTNKSIIEKPPDIPKFVIKFRENVNIVKLTVQGLYPLIIPYLRSYVVNGVQLCKNPNSGAFEEAIQGIIEEELKPLDGSCGRRKIVHTALITNGLASKPGDWPWHVAVYRRERISLKYICGGTLVSKDLVLTAAHCVTTEGVPVVPEIVGVVLGKHNLIGGDEAAQEKDIIEVIVHHLFVHTNLENDLALLKLDSEAEYNEFVQPACLWTLNLYQKLYGKELIGTVVGWGFDQTDKPTIELHQAVMPKISDTTCRKKNPVFYAKVLTDRKFCAGFANGTSACNGDSGGGYFVFVPDTIGDDSPDAPGTWHVRGIVSLTLARKDKPVCDPEAYVVFTDLAPYLHWLQQYVN